jgi:lysophospholipase
LVEHPEVFERAVVIAPMVRFIGGLLPSLILVALRLMCGLGLGGWYFLRRDYHPDEVVFEGNPLTSDAARFQTKPDCVRQNPRLAQGGPTLQWLVAAAASMAQLRRESGRIRIPVLMFAPEDERVVDGAFGEALVSSLAKGEVVSLADARHEVLFETDAVLAVFWGHCERFLRGPT